MKKELRAILNKIELPARFQSNALVTGALLLMGAALASLIAYPPLISRAGDTFGCWYGYIANWHAGGLELALKSADATGRYPGYAYFIMLTQQFLHVDFLQALLVSRYLSVLVSFFACYLLLRQGHLPRVFAAIFALFVSALPIHWVSLTLNSQDTLKVPFFLLAIWAFLAIEESKNLNALKRILFYFVMWTSSIGLALTRGPEVLPFFGFVVFYKWFKTREQQVPTKFFHRLGLIAILPGFLALVGIHCYGWVVVGHFAVSGQPSVSADVWPKLLLGYLKDSGISPFIAPFKIIKIAIVTFFNKVGYIVEDFVFNQCDTRILDNHFVFSLQLLSPARIILYFPLGMYLTYFVVKSVRSENFRLLARAFLFAGLVSAVFYTFFINHYEQRYWLLFSYSTLIAVFIQYGKSSQSSRWLVACAVLLICFEIPRGIDIHEHDLRIDAETTALAAKWTKDAEDLCARNIRTVVVPDYYLLFTAYKYFAPKACPGLQLVNASEYHDNTQASDVVKFDTEYFEEAHILGFSHNHFSF